MVIRSALAVNDQQARLLASRKRVLRYQFRGELVVEFGKTHREKKKVPPAGEPANPAQWRFQCFISARPPRFLRLLPGSRPFRSAKRRAAPRPATARRPRPAWWGAGRRAALPGLRPAGRSEWRNDPQTEGSR